MAADNNLTVLSDACCTPAPSPTLHEELASLLSQYDVNAAAASVKVYAVKPGSHPTA
jgi:arsenite methyltransferase